jgi:hypothetical protein
MPVLESISAAQARFLASMSDPESLVAIHRQLNSGRGKRHREVVLNRAIVVLTVAAWQALVQDLAEAALVFLSPPAGKARYDYNLLKATTKNAIHGFSTPNAENCRTLLLRVGMDPWPYWSWASGSDAVTRAVARQRLNQWLTVRHSIAHGDAEWPDVTVLSQLPSGSRTLRRADAERCMRLFDRLASLTAGGLDRELQGT